VSSATRFKKPPVFQLGLNGRRLCRANFFDVQGFGRFEDCEKDLEPDRSCPGSVVDAKPNLKDRQICDGASSYVGVSLKRG
jgi:hypothetical protein